MLFSKKLCLSLAFFLCLSACPARGGDSIEAITVAWRDFIAAVRRGGYAAAHSLFSEQSREVFPFPAFVAEYGPLSAARETLMLDPSSLTTDVDGDWGVIKFTVTLPVTGQVLRVGASFVKNDDVWALVAARNETREQLEAAVRSVLRRLKPYLAQPDSEEKVADAVRRDLAASPLSQAYDIAVQNGVLSAKPKVAGLRAFHIDSWGRVRQGATRSGLGELQALPAAAAKPAAVTPARPQQSVLRQVPEFTDIPSPIIVSSGSTASPLGELPEPPAGSESAGPGELPDPGMLPTPGELPEPGSFQDPYTLPEPDLPLPVSPLPETYSGNDAGNRDAPGYLSLPDRIS